MAEKNEIAKAESFALVTEMQGVAAEDMDELRDELDDLDGDVGITSRQIKIPAGGKLAYEVQGDEDGDEEYLKEIDGVIVFTHRMNGYWKDQFGSSSNPEDKLPVCSSRDGKTGFNVQTGEYRSCDTCPLNQFGSDRNGGKGKACKNMRKIYLMRQNDPNVYVLTVPPTSVKDVNKTLTRFMAAGTPYTGMVVTFRLNKSTNAGGIDYSTIVIERKGSLAPDQAAKAKQIRAQLKEQYARYSSADFANDAAQTVSDADFTEVRDTDELPFK